MSKPSDAPFTSEEFNKVYSSFLSHWFWSDIRIPKELKELIKTTNPKTSLELGTGIGLFSKFVAEQGIKAIGVDFSSVAIEKAKARVIQNEIKPNYLVGDVTNLNMISEKFDTSFDIGCFHCLDEEGHQKYVEEIYRLSNPNSLLLIWALDTAPSDLKINPDYIENIFEKRFRLLKHKISRRRIIGSHWYWLVRKD